MAAPLTLRGSEGIWMTYGPPNLGSAPAFHGDQTNTCRAMTFSLDGSLFAWCTSESISIVETASDRLVQKIDISKVVELQLSPLGNIVAAWKHYSVDPETKQGSPNLILFNTKTGECVKEFNQKKQINWCPQWSQDEGICCRNVNNELHFFENNDFENIKTKLHLQKVSEFELAPCPAPYILSAYVPGAKGQPSFVRVYQYPNFGGPSAALANKSFFKAERVTMVWNKQGTAVLILTSTEVSESSYYGEQGLHYISTKGESCLVPLSKNGPIYSITWNPNLKSQEFCVVYGYMPSKVSIYNMKCEPLFDFGTGPRNMCFYNPHGNILCLAGFGNLNGNLEFWDLKQKKLICQMKAQDTTSFEWCPDGEHFVTATTSPRLRVGNCYKIWHYTGTLMAHEPTKEGHQLWEVLWKPVPAGVYKEKAVRYKAVESSAEVEQPAAKVGVYRPPGARGEAASFKLHEFEAPTNVKTDAGQDKPTGQALKNKKKRDAKKAKAEQKRKEEEEGGVSVQTSCPPQSAQQGAKVGGGGAGPSHHAPVDPEVDKQRRKIKKKLQQIEKIKDQQRDGKQLEINQLEKLKTEESLLEELKSLSVR
ncbi:eukaryotic translation initiation factor 2A-like [Haliotis asinina]|uniref:eukaryotic translation initiation factor 2A-like n=1 Tax=Haliotis asinina TaxID=109174 RepID=UPI0035324D0D